MGMGWGWGGDGAAEPALQHRLAEPCQHPGGARQLRVPSTGSSRAEGVPVSPLGSDHPRVQGLGGEVLLSCTRSGIRAGAAGTSRGEAGGRAGHGPTQSTPGLQRVPEGLRVRGCRSSGSPRGALTPRRASTGAGIHHRTSERVPQVPSTHRAISALSPPAPLLREPPTTRDLHPGSSPTPGTAGPSAPGMRVTSLLR